MPSKKWHDFYYYYIHKERMTTQRWIIFLIWISIILAILYLYFFQPGLFNRMFHYPGAGSPYVNTPSGY